MGIINSAIEKRTSSLAEPSQELMDYFNGGIKSVAGANVNPKTALKNTAVFSCVKILSESIAQMPLSVKTKENNIKKDATDHPVYSLLHDEPNPEMHIFDYKRLKMVHLNLWGNAYSEIEFNGKMDPVGLWPIPPWRCDPKRDNNKNLVYEVKLADNTIKTLQPWQIIHDKGLSVDGLKGMTPIGQAREAIGLAMAAEEYGARFFGSGSNVGGFIKHPDKLQKETFDKVRDSMQKKYAGLANSHRLMFLDEGMEYQKVGIPPEDAQFLATRQFQVAEIARIYNVPLVLLQEHEKQTSWGTGVEQQVLAFIIFTINPYIISFEKEYDRKLIKKAERGIYYTKHNVEGLLRGDSQARADFYDKMIRSGIYTINDSRRKEDLDPIGPAGDINWVPMNMMPAEQALPEKEETNSISNLREKRDLTIKQIRSATERFRIAKKWESKFENAAQKVVEREIKNLKNNVKNHFSERSVTTWEDFLSKYYDDFGGFIGRVMLTTFLSFGKEIQRAAALEVGFDVQMTSKEHRFINEYKDAFVARHASSSKGQLLSVARKALEEGKDPVALIEQRLDEWQEKRPEKVASRETVQLSGAVALLTYRSAGRTKKRWAAIGAETCPFCQEMDGVVVGIEDNFVGDEKLKSEEENEGMRIYRPIMHPQLHGGCVCQIVAD